MTVNRLLQEGVVQVLWNMGCFLV